MNTIGLVFVTLLAMQCRVAESLQGMFSSSFFSCLKSGIARDEGPFTINWTQWIQCFLRQGVVDIFAQNTLRVLYKIWIHYQYVYILKAKKKNISNKLLNSRKIAEKRMNIILVNRRKMISDIFWDLLE